MASPPPSKPQTLDPTSSSPPPSSPASAASADPREDLATTEKSVEIEISKGEEAEGEEEEEAECGFCIWMKGGGCKDAFMAWEDCIKVAGETGEDVVEKCFEVTSLLKQCMEAHSEYYDPILQAEKAMAKDVESELEAEKSKEEGESSAEPKSASAPESASERDEDAYVTKM